MQARSQHRSAIFPVVRHRAEWANMRHSVLRPARRFKRKGGGLQEAMITSIVQGFTTVPTSLCPTYRVKVNCASQVSAQKRNVFSGQASC